MITEILRSWIFLVAVVVIGIVSYFWIASSKYIEWREKLPSIENYKEKCKKKQLCHSDDLVCIECGSREITSTEVNFAFRLKGFLHKCAKCGTWLYRS
jgi:hypothetical protein